MFMTLYPRYFKENESVEGWFCCPCCSYPTLGARGEYEICGLCWWEDDGYGGSGPNHGYQLAEAQRNFEDHGDMCRLDSTRIEVVARPSFRRKALLSYVRSLGEGEDGRGGGRFDLARFSELQLAAG